MKGRQMRAWHGINPLPPEYWQQPGGWYYYSKTITTTNTPLPEVQPVDEERVRRIVREEIADIMPIDVPDAPPEGLG